MIGKIFNSYYEIVILSGNRELYMDVAKKDSFTIQRLNCLYFTFACKSVELTGDKDDSQK